MRAELPKKRSCSRRPVLAEDRGLSSTTFSSSPSPYPSLRSPLPFAFFQLFYHPIFTRDGITESSRDRPGSPLGSDLHRALLYFRQKGGCRVIEALSTEKSESCHYRSSCNFARAVVRICVFLSLQGFSEQYRHLSPPGENIIPLGKCRHLLPREPDPPTAPITM